MGETFRLVGGQKEGKAVKIKKELSLSFVADPVKFGRNRCNKRLGAIHTKLMLIKPCKHKLLNNREPGKANFFEPRYLKTQITQNILIVELPAPRPALSSSLLTKTQKRLMAGIS